MSERRGDEGERRGERKKEIKRREEEMKRREAEIKRRERSGHEEEGEKKRTRERRSLNSRLWAAPLKVVEIREEPRKEERRERTSGQRPTAVRSGRT